MRIPDELMPLVRELAEAHLERVAGDLRVMKSFRSPDHPHVVLLQHHLLRAQRLDALVNPRRRVA